MINLIANRYRILNLIGQGGMADVYLARDVILNRDVAIKVLRPKLSEDAMTLVRFTREASAASRLSHPNVVDIYDVGETDGLHYLVMEYIKGQTLKQMITRRGALDCKEALSIMNQLTSAIVSAHSHQIIHRDIKPQNILVKSDGTIKITDFGIAVANGSVSLTHNNAVMGSAHYLSPESARGKSPDEKVDIYSMGIVFYELLTGEVPYKGTTPAEIAIRHMTEPLPSVRKFNPQIPQSIENIVIRASAKDPQERYQSAAEMMEDLKHCLDPEHRNDPPLVLKTQKLDALPGSSSSAAKSAKSHSVQHSGSYIRSEQMQNRQKSAARTGGLKKTSQTAGKDHAGRTRGSSGLLRGLIIVLVSAFLALATAAALMNTGVIRISGMMGYITFPDLSEETLDQARSDLIALGFDPDSIAVEETVSDATETGDVISASISPGQIVKTSSPVTLQVSKGPSYLISDYSGLYLDDVKNQLAADGVTMEYQISYEGTANTVPGIILSQSGLRPGDRIDPAADNVISLTVSQYPSLTVPADLIGMEIEEAKSLLNSMGAAVVVSPSTGSGTVTSVDPPVGSVYTQEGTDTVITLYD